jgi:hypothetical protein
MISRYDGTASDHSNSVHLRRDLDNLLAVADYMSAVDRVEWISNGTSSVARYLKYRPFGGGILVVKEVCSRQM